MVSDSNEQKEGESKEEILAMWCCVVCEMKLSSFIYKPNPQMSQDKSEIHFKVRTNFDKTNYVLRLLDKKTKHA